jgi:phage terminase large subunit GpA-like protein
LIVLDYLSYPGWPLELSAWAPPEDITVSEWAESYRVLPKASAIPGRWNNHLGPYAVGVMNAGMVYWSIDNLIKLAELNELI